MIERIANWLIGADSGSTSGEGRLRLEWLAFPGGDRALVVLLLLVAALAGIWWLYRWEARNLNFGARLLLSVFRAGVLFAVLAMLLEPVLVRSMQEFIPSHLIVLLDTSESMGLKDAWRDESSAAALGQQLQLNLDGLRRKTRLELAWEILNKHLKNELTAGGDRIVHVHSFSERLESTPLPEDASQVPAATGRTTAIGTSLRQALAAYRGLPVAGVLLISDGQSNGGESAISASQAAADEGVTLVAMAAGTTDGPRNAAIKTLDASPVVFERDTNRVNVVVESRGLSETPATITLERRRGNDPWQEIGREAITLGTDNRLTTVVFDYTEDQPGRLQVRARVEDLGAELTTDDNTSMADVRVIPQKIRVLLVAGSAFPEVQFLRNALMRDKTIEVSTWLMAADETYEHPGTIPIQRLPNTQEELDQMDCVVLYDPDPERWPENFPELLSRFVGHAGGGLVYIAGEMHTAQLFEQQDDPAMKWLSLLPVVREPGLFRSEVQMRLSAQSPWQLRVTPDGRDDPVFAFSENREENSRVLENLPGMFWHFSVTRAKPGALVLAQHGDPRMQNEYGPEVLLATQLVGPGRTFFVGFDSTYRWRFLNEQYFDGFWARLIGRAGRNKQLGGNYPFRLTADRAVYRPGSQARISARFIDPTSMDPALRMLHGEIERGDEEPVPITLEPGSSSDEFVTSYTFTRAGPHLVRVWAGDDAARGQTKAATLPLKVELPNLEYENPVLDQARLESMAAETGGEVVRLSDSDAAAAAFKTRRVTRVFEERRELWNAPILFGTIFLLLLAEWLVRKRHRLI